MGNLSEDSSPLSPSRGQPASALALASGPLRGQPAPAPAQQLGNALGVTGNVSSAAKESLTTLLDSLDSIDMITESQRLHAIVQKLTNTFYKQHSEMAEQHTQLLASKEAQQKLQEAAMPQCIVAMLPSPACNRVSSQRRPSCSQPLQGLMTVQQQAASMTIGS
ncbi:TPA: hypothetical protein ACH3X1_008642 [Trebouxia sp. C0004]